MNNNNITRTIQSCLQNKTILIISGEWITSFFISEYLYLANNKVKIISHTPKDVWEENFPDGYINLILNVINPIEMTKYELTQKLRRRYRETPIIVYGATRAPEDVDACYKAGCSRYIPIPIHDFEQFDNVLIQYLEKQNTINNAQCTITNQCF